ncbi:MAG: glycosyltransferase family 39 protein, partial [Victivallales bacterium]|nr:glycosyltransferase family 39 protein [Victivallales bacterium]
MEKSFSKQSKIFYAFLICQFFFWAVIPSIFLKTIPLDTSEGVAWGCEWQWGYYKHPPLAAWLSNLAVVLQGSPGFTLYALAQICIIITFIAVWKLSKNMMNENYALISVISISTIYYYSFPTCTFNPNVISFPISALLILFIYKVSRKYSVFNWCVIGVLAGLSVLAKYVGAFIFLPALVYFIINRDIRKQILSVGFLLAFILYFFIITPHLIWLFNNDFEPVNYAFGKTDVFFTVKSIWDHIHWPLDYIVNIILPAIPLIIITVILCFKNGKDEKIERNFQ